MPSPGGTSLSAAPIIQKLDTSRSLRRSLLSSNSSISEDSPNGGRRCAVPSPLAAAAGAGAGAVELSPRSRPSSFKSVSSDEFSYVFVKTARVSWAAVVVLATFGVVLVVLALGIHRTGPPSSWRSQSGPCPSSTALPSSVVSLVEGLPPSSISSNWRTSSQERDNEFGEEDEKCLSRTRHLKYRRRDRHYPTSQLLADAISQYSSMHARCTAGKSWEQLFTSTTSDATNNQQQQPWLLSGNDSCKYLMYMEGWEGLGNRLLSLVSAFTYALVTGRVLLLDSRRNMPGLLCEPFGSSSWALPGNFPYEKVDALPTLGSLKNESQLEQLQSMPAVNVLLRHIQSDSEQQFFCPHVQQKLNEVPWIGWISNQYYVPRLLTIPEFWARLNPLIGEDPSCTFTQLSRLLLLPRNSIWARTERVYRAYLEEARKLVGMQLRTPQAKTFEQPIQDRIIRCLVSDGVLPKPSSWGEAGGQQQVNPWERKSSRYSEKSEKRGVSIFVASLQRMYFEKIRDLYDERGTDDGTLVSVHTMATDLEAHEDNSLEQAARALVDMWLLSFSDSLVTSGWSTFGYVAQGLGGLRPYIINTNLEQKESCGEGQSAEPCNHFPFVSACPDSQGSMSPEQAMWIERHVKACQDEANGLQLVSNRTT